MARVLFAYEIFYQVLFQTPKLSGGLRLHDDIKRIWIFYQ